MNLTGIASFADDSFADYDIAAPSPTHATRVLSGGNLQKVVMARELAGQPRLLIVHQPTRGLDIGASEYVRRRLIEERDRGAAVLLISEDLDELLNLSSRIAVLFDGRIVGEVDRRDANHRSDRSLDGRGLRHPERGFGVSTRLPTTPAAPSRSLLHRVGWRLERRLDVKPWHEAVTLVASFLVGLAICSILIAASDKSIFDSYRALFDGAFGSRRAIYETLVQATPLIFTGLAAAFAFRARVWNIGGEGQFFAGAMGAFFVSDLWSDVLPRVVMVPVLFVGAAAAGALWASIAGVLKARYDTNEIITTVMLNFIILLILSYLLGDLWRAPDTYYFQTERLPESTHLPLMIGGSRLHWGFGVALAMAAAVLVVLRRTALGYEVRGVGINRTAGS